MVTSPPDPQFLPATNNPQPNTELIRDALLRGESVPEADFVRGRHLRLYDPTGSLLLSGSSLLAQSAKILMLAYLLAMLTGDAVTRIHDAQAARPR